MNEPSAVQSLARSWSWKRFFVRSSLICLALCVGAVAIGVWKIRSTLPRLDGTLRVVGIQHKVQIQRDNLGVPSILAQSRDDAAYGLGFAHAQDRFFQMDLLRRIPSGRMGELFGKMGLRCLCWIGVFGSIALKRHLNWSSMRFQKTIAAS